MAAHPDSGLKGHHMAAIAVEYQAHTRVAGPRQVARDLMSLSARTLTEASLISDAPTRYVTAHLAALRAAAAVLAARALPEKRRRTRVRNTWVLLPKVAPELTEWAEFFSATAVMRARLESGIDQVSPRAADDLVRDAENFLGTVRRLLDMPHQVSIR
jgi:hypothetical protein